MNLKKCIYLSTVILASLSTLSYADNIETLEYPNWQIEYNCDKKGYQYFHYVTVPDSGNIGRVSKFTREDRLPEGCGQKSTYSYKLPKGSPITYDRGHGVHQNIWDHNQDLMILSNKMANIVPQASQLNRRGVWRKTEELTECYRDIGTVEVWGGVIWGDDSSNDHFIVSHGVVTPDFLWKVIKFPNGEVNAWLMPNDNTPTAVKMDTYLVSPAKIENAIGKKFDIDRKQRSQLDSYSMPRPRGCSIS